jgi:hypothetical protein
MAGITPPASGGGSTAGLATLASPTFTGDVVVPNADAATEAMNRQTSDARYAGIAAPTGVTSGLGIPGLWYGYPGYARGSNVAMQANAPYYQPLFIPVAKTIVAAGMYVVTGAASSFIHAAIYDDDDGGFPGTRLFDINGGAPWDGSANNTFRSTASLSMALTPGMYWIAVMAVGGTPAVNVHADMVTGMPLAGDPVSYTPQDMRMVPSPATPTTLIADVSAYTYTYGGSASSTPIVWLKA